MKYILLTAAMLMSLGRSFAQNTYTQVQDSLMQHLDITLISTGILYDRVYPWASLTHINSGTDTIDYDYAKQAWHELELASYVLTDDMHTLESIKESIRQNTAEGKGISIGYIDIAFNSMDSNAVINGALTIGTDGLWYDGGGTTGAPSAYLNHYIQFPFIAADILRGDSVKFYFDPEIKLQNTLNGIAYMEMETNGGSSITIYPGEEKHLSITGIATDIINIRVKIWSSDGEITAVWDNRFRNGNIMEVTSTSITTDSCVSDVFKYFSGSSLAFQGYDESAPTQGFGEYRIFRRRLGSNWSSCATGIAKPVIIMDGFDPEDKRKITQVDDTLGVWDLLGYSNKHLGDSLRYAGFDVIILNFPTYNTIENNEERFGGADYIERNAMVLVKLIQDINDSLALQGSNEKIVIVGPSMGGQISRYALAYMEKHNALGTPKMNHNTRLFVSFDSPHLGANIPISAQQFLSFFGYNYNELKAKTQYETQLRSKAARQMLIHQMDGLNRSASFFTTYYNNLVANGTSGSQGWPLNMRKVTLTNGGNRGINVAPSGGIAVQVNAATYLGINGISLTLRNQRSDATSLLTMDGYALKEGVTYFGAPYSNTTTQYSTPTTNMQFTYKYRDFGIPFIVAPLYKRLFSYDAEYTSTNMLIHGSMDVAQGGLYTVYGLIIDQVKDKLNSMNSITSKTWSHAQRDAAFIPTVSAIGFKNYNFNWESAFNNRNLLCNNEIYFDNYFIPQQNESHVVLTAASANWVIDEIINGQSDCPPVCTYKINGTESYMCAGTNYTFSLDVAAPANSLVQWTYSSGLTVIGTPNNTQITLRPQLGAWDNDMHVTVEIIPRKWNGTTWVKCGASKIIKKKISYGNSSYSLSYTNNTYTFDVRVQPNIAGDTYRWAMDGVTFGAPTSSFAQFNINKIALINAPKHFKVEVKPNGCPLGEILTGEYYVLGFEPTEPIKGRASEECNYVAFPNPGESYWDISLCGLDIEKQIEIINASGQLVASYKTLDLLYKIDISSYSKGVYIIKVKQGSDVQIIKATKI